MPNFEFIASIIELAMDRTNSALLKRYIIQNSNILLEVKVAELRVYYYSEVFEQMVILIMYFTFSCLYQLRKINLKVDTLQMHET